jgi:cytochrome c556
MKNLRLAVAVSFTLAAAVVAAAAERGSGQKTAPTGDAKQAQMMQETMAKMHEQLHKIMETKDPVERERLRQEQLKTTQEFMKQMRESMGGTAMMDEAGQPGATERPAGKRRLRRVVVRSALN